MLEIVQILCGAIWCLFSSGIVFGFAALKPILVGERVYSELCDAGKTDQYPCVAQDLKLNELFAVAAIVTNVMALPIGWILDYYGPLVVNVIGATFLTLSSIVFIFSKTFYQYFDSYLVGFCFLAFGGPFVFISCFHLSNAIPKRSGLIMALITGTFDSSSALFLFYKKIYEASEFGVSLRKFFTVYLIVPVFILLCQMFVMPRKSYQSQTHDQDDELDPVVEQVITSGTETPISEEIFASHSGNRQPAIEVVAEGRMHIHSDHTFGLMHNYSVKRQIKTPWFGLMLVFASICMLRINYFVATIRSQEEYLLGDTELAKKLNSIFDVALPLGGIIAIPLVGMILDSLDMLLIISLLSTLSVLIGAMGLVPHAYKINLIGILLLVLYRPFYYTVVSHYTSKTFGFKTFGTVYGLLTSVCGLCNIFQSTLDKMTHRRFEMNPIPVNAVLLAITVLSAGSLISFVSSKRATHQKFLKSNANSLEQARLTSQSTNTHYQSI